MKTTEKATKVSRAKRILEGEKQRRHLLFLIEDNPGLTAYQISQRLGWTRGKVTYHLNKLTNQGELRKTSIENNPHPKKVYHIVKWEKMINWGTIPEEQKPKKTK
ncbi:MAG: MarR family transcriptional regulator [Candidatus Heimdallarchaeota archaeon]|nr:MarR family transcriptional regulator [Candidatus Heimdallarchaeota archaeon]